MLVDIVKTGLAPLSEELEETIQKWLDGNENIEILTTSISYLKQSHTPYLIYFLRPLCFP